MKQSKLPFPQVKRKLEAVYVDDESSEDEYEQHMSKINKVSYSKVIVVDVFSNKKGLVEDLFTDDEIIKACPPGITPHPYNVLIESYKALREAPSLELYDAFESSYTSTLISLMVRTIQHDPKEGDVEKRTILMPFGTFFVAVVIMYDAYLRKVIPYEHFRMVRDRALNGKTMHSLRMPYMNNYYLELYQDFLNPQADNDNMDLTLLEYIREVPKLMSIFTDRRTAHQPVSLSKHYDLKKLMECTQELVKGVKEEDFITWDKL